MIISLRCVTDAQKLFLNQSSQSLILSAFHSTNADGTLVLGPAESPLSFGSISVPCSLWRICWEMSHISRSDERAVKCLFLFSSLARHRI